MAVRAAAPAAVQAGDAVAAAEIGDAVARIRRWGEFHDWYGYDPYDALNSPFAPLLTLGTRTGRRLLLQAVKTSPVDLRPALRIRPERNGKAVALAASAYCRLVAADDHDAGAWAASLLDWLERHPSPDAGVGRGWGYNFDVETRFFGYARETPNAIATSFALQALLDAIELAGEDREEAAGDAATFLAFRLLRRDGDRSYFAYLPGRDELIHNANLLAAAALARAARVLRREELATVAARAARTTLAAQRPDGSWPYAERGGDWVDGFHTGYVLESLAELEPVTPAAGAALERGLAHWEAALFDPDGRPRYYEHRALPRDAHCYAQAIETWLAVEPFEPGRALPAALRVARLLVADLLHPDGWVVLQRRRFWTVRAPCVRWSTAPAFRALARLLARLAAGNGAGR